MQGVSRAALVLAWLGALALSTPALAGGPDAGRVIKGLKARSLKVRLKAATVAGQRKITKAAPALRKVADNQREKPAVRAAALNSLGQIGDQDSRGRCAYLAGHSEAAIANAARRALAALDKALPSQPFFLVSIEPPGLPKGTPKRAGQQLMKALMHRARSTNGLVLGHGEEKYMSEAAFAEHLGKRDLVGLLLKPQLAKLTATPADGRTTVVALIRLVQFRLPGRVQEFTAEGGADAWIESERLTKRERQELEDEVIEGAADAALMQLLQDLQERSE